MPDHISTIPKDETLYLVLEDSSVLRYRLEGNTSDDSPVLVFIHDALTNLQIWDPTIALFKELHPKYRLLRYDIRGYSADSIGTSDSISLALLASDLHALLTSLSISHIQSIIGLGLGAHIGLTLLVQSSSLASSFVGIGFAIRDSPITSLPSAVDEWALRSSLARRVGMGLTGDKAVARWFTADARGSSEWVRVRDIVAAGDIEGMDKLSVAVLESVGHSTAEKDHIGQNALSCLGVPTLFVCGAGDGILPEEMGRYPGMMRDGKGRFASIARANRLVCCERASEFVDLLADWLSRCQ